MTTDQTAADLAALTTEELIAIAQAPCVAPADFVRCDAALTVLTQRQRDVAATKATAIRPGLMVLVRTSVRGGVSYQRVDLEETDLPEGEAAVAEAAVEDKSKVTVWQTTKVVDDPAEFERASKVRNKARGLISKVCASTSFGLLCPEANEEALDASIAAARALVSAHNATATCTQIHVYAIKGRVSSDDRAAVEAITSEVRELVADMNAGILAVDPKAIRDAADKARDVAAMLAPEQSELVAEAVKQARAAARAIVSRVQTNGEDAAVVLLDVQRGAIEKARIAFLDLDEPQAVATGPAMPAVAVQRFADLDMAGPSSEEAVQ